MLKDVVKNMTFSEIQKIVENNNIPLTVELLSDSGWECCATRMDGVYYNEKLNKMVFTQKGDKYDDYYDDPEWKLLNGV